MQNTSNKIILILLTSLCFLAFFLFGITDNLKGPTLPAMLVDLNISYGTSGNIFFYQYLGFLIATLITGLLADRFGLKVVIILAGIFLAAGVAGYSSFSTPTLLSTSLFIIGLGLGAFELGPNAVIVNLYHENKGLYLNLMAVMHGLGSMVAPLFASLFIQPQNNWWRTAYRWDLLLILFFVALAASLSFPKSDEKSALDFRAISQVAFKPPMPLYYAAMLFYVAAEIGFSSWLVVYLQEERNVFNNNFLVLFFGLMMIGRFAGSFVVSKLGYLRSILIASLLALTSLGLGLFSPLTFFLPITGLFFSIIFPTLTAAVSDEAHENINSTLGVLFTFSGLGGALGPWAVAWGSQYLGLQTGFSLLLLMTLLTTIFIFNLVRRKTHGQSS